MEEIQKKYYSKSEAKPKIEYYCRYQERCQKEVIDKLYQYGLKTSEVNEMLMQLVEKGLVNEQRFAIAFAGGKFRQKKWGRTKIIRELKWRNISDYCIQKALKEIDDEDYHDTIKKTALKYSERLVGEKPFVVKQKTIKYLLSKGFEYEQCHSIIESIT